MAKKVPRRAIALGATALTVLPSSADGQPVPICRGYKITVNGLVVEGAPTFAQAEHAGLVLRVAERCGPFALGDYILDTEQRFGEEAAQILDESSGWSLRTMSVYRWLAERIAPERRRMDRLGVKHHLLVATLSAAKQAHWLTQAAADDEEQPWTAARLAAALREGEDLPPAGLWLLVACETIQDQLALQAQLEGQGRTCRAVVRRKKKAPGSGS